MLSIPLSSDYKASILNADSSFDTLKPIEPVLENGEPKFASGAFAIVFKMQKPDENKNYAIKCFTTNIANRNQRLEAIYNYVSKIASPHFAKFHFLPNELWVNITPTEGYEYPIVAMEWIEGKTLGETLRLACEANDTTQLRQLLTQFIDLALMLMALPIAHGDLKHDNIIVDKNGTLVLVDYDGMFVPALKGEQANELGSEDYQHQSRNASIFDRHIDDWSIAIIALSIAVLIQKPSLYAQYNHGQNLVFSRKLWKENKLHSIIDFELHLQVNSLLDLLETTNHYQLPTLFNNLVVLREFNEEMILEPIFDSQAWWDGLDDLWKDILVGWFR
jgi:serine/threonine protein kinase